MRAIERKSMWHHAVFSGLMCLVLVGLVIIRRDIPSISLVLLIAAYITGNTLIHYRRKDFHKETLYEYLLVGLAVLSVLLSAFRH